MDLLHRLDRMPDRNLRDAPSPVNLQDLQMDDLRAFNRLIQPLRPLCQLLFVLLVAIDHHELGLWACGQAAIDARGLLIQLVLAVPGHLEHSLVRKHQLVRPLHLRTD